MSNPELGRGAFMATEGQIIYDTWLGMMLEDPDDIYADFRQHYATLVSSSPPRTAVDSLYAVGDALMGAFTDAAYKDTPWGFLNDNKEQIYRYTSVENATAIPTGHALDGFAFSVGFPLAVAYDSISDVMPGYPTPMILEETARSIRHSSFLKAMESCGKTAFAAWMAGAAAIGEGGRERRAEVTGLVSSNGRALSIATYDPETRRTCLRDGVKDTLLAHLRKQNREGADGDTLSILSSDIVERFKRQVSSGCPVASPVKGAEQSGIERATLFTSWVLGRELGLEAWPANFDQ